MAGVAAGLQVVAAFWIAGFWWLDGVDATREQYHAAPPAFVGGATSRSATSAPHRSRYR